MNAINVKFKRLHPDAKIPQYATEMAAGFDLVAVEDVIITPSETAKVPLGFAVQIPAGNEIQIRPRSGVSANTKLRVNLGTIDADYRGEVAVLIDNIAPVSEECYPCAETLDGFEFDPHGLYPYNTYLIRKGDRIAQGVLAPVLRASFEEVAELDDTERGSGGFGSSGVTSE